MPVRLTIGQIAAIVVIVLVLILAGWAGWQGWRARHWKDTAQHNADAAKTAQGNADSANAGAANATGTRAAIDATAGAARDAATPSAESIRSHEDTAQPAPGPVPADVVRELREGERRARAAADRLQRARSR